MKTEKTFIKTVYFCLIKSTIIPRMHTNPCLNDNNHDKVARKY